jgi:hypothetical protein
MKTGLALFFMISVSIVFTVWKSQPAPKCTNPVHLEGEPRYDLFPYSDHKITLENYVYYIFEHLFLMLILFMWFCECSDYSKDYVRAFLILQSVDFIDYLLSYNAEYFTLYNYPVSYNTIMIFTYMIYLTMKYGTDNSDTI